MDRSEAECRGPKAPQTRPRRREAGAQRAQSEHDSRRSASLGGQARMSAIHTENIKR